MISNKHELGLRFSSKHTYNAVRNIIYQVQTHNFGNDYLELILADQSVSFIIRFFMYCSYSKFNIVYKTYLSFLYIVYLLLTIMSLLGC